MTFWKWILNWIMSMCRQLGTIPLWWAVYLCQKLAWYHSAVMSWLSLPEINLLAWWKNEPVCCEQHTHHHRPNPARCSLCVILGVCITMEKDSAAQAEVSCEDPHKAYWHLTRWCRACCWEHDVSARELEMGCPPVWVQFVAVAHKLFESVQICKSLTFLTAYLPSPNSN